MANKLEQRFWELDFMRGIAIIMMILFHLLYDLNYFAGYDLNVHSGFWLYFGRATATIFILLVGISLTISYTRAKKKQKKRLYRKYLKRGLKIFAWGLLITLATWLFLRAGFVVFGVLHLIGISIILAYPFLKLRLWNLLPGVLFTSLGLYLKNYTFGFSWLIWLGLRPEHIYTIDYFPILPWFGVILIGLFLGHLIYPECTRRFNLFDLSNFAVIRLICLFGMHSLLIYLIHQPILIAVLYLWVL